MRTFAQEQNQPQELVSSSLTRSNAATSDLIHHVHPMLHSQRTSGNQAVQRLLPANPEGRGIQDNIAGNSAAPPIVNEVLRSPGQPLDAATRAFMEPRLGHDFSRVRVHTDTQAAESARGMNAPAYTVGRHIVFGADQYNPNSHQGRHLLTHELAHVVQQRAICDGSQRELTLGPPSDIYEREAEQTAVGVAAAKYSETGNSNTALISLPAALKPAHRRDSPVVQRFIPGGVIWDPMVLFQAAGQLAQTAIYNQAVSQLQSIDPAIHRSLSAVSPGRGPTAIKSGQLTTQDVPPVTLQFTFNLDVRFTTLSGRQEAKFTGGTPSLTGSGNTRTLTADMVMEIAPVSGPGAVTSLARNLYHEGIHMLLFMEQLLPSTTPSAHMATLTNYTRIARQHQEHKRLLAELEVFIELDLRTRKLTPPSNYARKSAQEIVDHLIEEKYVFDQERRQFGTQFTNQSLALTYTMEGFQAVGVRATQTDPNVRSIIAKATQILDDIDRQIRPQPSSPKPATPSPSSPPSPNP